MILVMVMVLVARCIVAAGRSHEAEPWPSYCIHGGLGMTQLQSIYLWPKLLLFPLRSE